MDYTALKQLANDAISNLAYDSAIFYANKLIVADSSSFKIEDRFFMFEHAFDIENVYILLQAYYHTEQFRRATKLFESYSPENSLHSGLKYPNPIYLSEKYINTYLQCLYIVSKCYCKVEKWQECINLLELFDKVILSLKIDISALLNKIQKQNPSKTKITAFLNYIRAEAFESLDIRFGATEWYKKALMEDVRCYEAWKKLNEGAMLNSQDEISLLSSLSFPSDLEWLKALYLSNTRHCVYNSSNSIHDGQSDSMNNQIEVEMIKSSKSHPKPSQLTLIDLSIVNKLKSQYKIDEDQDFICSQALTAFESNQFKRSFELTQSLLSKDPYCTNALVTHLSCLVELDMKNELFVLAHKLVDETPKSALAWYAVGCYYFAIGSWKESRKYFTKATTIDKNFAAAWLGFGHAFANDNEHDLTFAAYRNAGRLFPGSHLPYLALSIELCKTNQLNLAEDYAKRASEIQPNDPHPFHELGVVFFKNKLYDQAIRCFQNTLDMIGSQNLNEMWEPTLFNLASAYQLSGKLDKAITYFEMALTVLPYSHTTYTMLGITHHMCGNLDEAIDYYHQAISLEPDSFIDEMLMLAIKERASTITIGSNEEDTHVPI